MWIIKQSYIIVKIKVSIKDQDIELRLIKLGKKLN